MKLNDAIMICICPSRIWLIRALFKVAHQTSDVEQYDSWGNLVKNGFAMGRFMTISRLLVTLKYAFSNLSMIKLQGFQNIVVQD